MRNTIFLIFASFFAVGHCARIVYFSPNDPLDGGTQDADINDSDFISALNFAVARYNQGNSADTNLYQVVHIISAQAQVVAGASYTIVVKLGRTNCKKGEPSYGCTVYTDPAQAQTYQCKFVVWTRPWLNNIQVLNEACFEA